MKTRTCTVKHGCGLTKPEGEFRTVLHKGTNGAVRYTTNMCKECNAEQKRQYKARKRLDPEWLAKNAAYAAKRREDPAFRAKEAEYANNRRNDPVTGEIVKEIRRKYDQSPQGRKARRERQARRRANDAIYNLRETIRSVVRGAFRRVGVRKSKRSHEYCGCSFEYLYNRLTNNGKISRKGKHIDHIIPIKAAKIWHNKEDAVIALSHYSNLRLMSAKGNVKKSAKLPSIWEIPVDIHPTALAIYYKALKEQKWQQ